jgi:DNA-directed RNA polymerase subunit M/transcription elongation factor TFIIS
MPHSNVLVSVIACPECGTEMEGTWREPEDPEDEAPEPALQQCGSCTHTWTEPWPGWAFKTEAG